MHYEPSTPCCWYLTLHRDPFHCITWALQRARKTSHPTTHTQVSSTLHSEQVQFSSKMQRFPYTAWQSTVVANLRIWEVQGSNLGLQTGYYKLGLSWCFSVPPTKSQDSRANQATLSESCYTNHLSYKHSRKINHIEIRRFPMIHVLCALRSSNGLHVTMSSVCAYYSVRCSLPEDRCSTFLRIVAQLQTDDMASNPRRYYSWNSLHHRAHWANRSQSSPPFSYFS